VKKILFMRPEPWYVEVHMEYLIRFFGGKYIMDQGDIGTPEQIKANPMLRNPDEYDLLIPLLATHPRVDQVKYQHKIATILWEPCEGIWKESVLAAATTPMAVKSMERENHPHMHVVPGIDTNLFRPFKQAREDDLFHVGVMACLHNVRHRVKEVILPLMDIPGVKFDFYARNFFADRLNDKEEAGGQIVVDNIVDGNKRWVGIPNLFNRMDAILKVDADPGLTYSALEAAACGVPIIATDVGIEKLLTDKGAGILIEPDERDVDGNGRSWYLGNTDKVIERAREAIIELRDSREKRRIMAQNGRKELITNWTWEKRIPEWDKFFKEALKRAKK
jgi:glycosyltransferase involved in cell wall biosynthesis